MTHQGIQASYYLVSDRSDHSIDRLNLKRVLLCLTMGLVIELDTTILLL